MTNYVRMRQDANRMEFLEKAVAWLNEYDRPEINAEDRVRLDVTLRYAGSVNGAREAESLLREELHKGWDMLYVTVLDRAREELSELRAKWGLSEE